MKSLHRAELGLLSLGAGILILTLIAVSLHVPGSIWVGTRPRKDAVVALMLTSGTLYAIAVALVTRMPIGRRMIWPILGIAVALRLALVFAPPFMSSDIYRYVWDGRVQNASINPYVHIASDPALIGFRDKAIYPFINRVDYAHTIYPPAAEMIYAAVGYVSQTVLAMKIVMLLLEGCGIAAMLILLTQARLPSARILIYAWNPLALWAIAGDGHSDGAAIGLLGVAMLAAVLRRSGLAGALLAGAILTKFLPIAVAPALWRRWDWKMAISCAAVIAGLYAWYAKAGWLVLGFLPNYTREEGLAGGSGFWLLSALGKGVSLPHWAGPVYVLIAAGVLAMIAGKMVFGKNFDASPVAMGERMAILAAATTAAMSAHYPWYYAWLALPSCLYVRPVIIWLSIAPLLLYSDPFHDDIWLQTAVFMPALVILSFEIWRKMPGPLTLSIQRKI